MQELMNVTEACHLTGWSRQNIYLKKKLGRINLVKIKGRYYVTREELKRNLQELYKRDAYFAPDETGINGAAKILGITKNQMYYLIRLEKVPYRRIGALYIIKKSDLKTEQMRFEWDEKKSHGDDQFRRVEKTKEGAPQIPCGLYRKRLHKVFLEA